MVRRWWIEEKKGKHPRYVDRAPPVRVIAIVTLITTTLDLFADFILAIKLGQTFRPFTCPAFHASLAFFFFVTISVCVYVIEWIDCIVTLMNNQETRWLCRLSRSLGLVFEEVPLPACLLIIYIYQPRISLANPAFIASIIKLIALTWGIIKFIKIKFCWFFLPCTMDHGFNENVNRCFTFKLIRVLMLLVNICHIVAIVLTTLNIICYSQGGKPTPEREYPPCYPNLAY